MKILNIILRYRTILLLSVAFLIAPTSINAGPKSVSINDVALNEGNSGTTTFTFTVTATDRADGDSVDYTTVNNSAIADGDYIAQNGTITFTGNDKTETISILVNGDTDNELTETFTVVLSNPSGGGITSISDNTGLGTIIDDEPRTYVLTPGAIIVSEASGTASLNIRVDPAIQNNDEITVNYTTVDQTATAGTDFTATSGTATINSSHTSGTTSEISIPIPIISDLISEPQEYFDFVLSSPTVSSANGSTVGLSVDPGSVIINDDDATNSTISINNPTVNEGDTDSTMYFTVSLSAIQGSDVSFSYTTSASTATSDLDFINVSGTAIIQAGVQSVLIPVTIKGDTEAGEGSEELKMVIYTSSSSVDLGNDVGIGTIVDNDTGLTLSINDAFIAELDTDRNVNVDILFSQALTSDLSLTYETQDGNASSPSDYTGTTTSVVIPTGSTSYTLQVNIVGDNITEGNEDFIITIDESTLLTSEPIHVAKNTGTVTIFDDDANIGCSSHIGLMTINEYQNNPHYFDSTHYLAGNAGKVPGNYVEIKYLDFIVKQYVNDLWTLSIFTTAGTQQLAWDERDDTCIDPRYEVFQMDNNVMGAQGYVVLRDANNNEVDVLNIDNSDHYAQQCVDFIYDTDFDSSAQNKDIFREPDGTGDWTDNGNGANSGGSRCINKDGFGGLLFTKFDAIDAGVTPSTPIQNGGDVPIQTKVVNRHFPLDIISMEPSTGLLSNSTIKVRTYLADGITGERLINAQSQEVIFNNQQVVNVPLTGVNLGGYNYAGAERIVRLRFEYCGNDVGAYEDWDNCWLANDAISVTNQRVSHSRNAFAIRPDHFAITSSDDLAILKAGKEYNLIINAPDYLNNDTINYNQIKSNIELNLIRYFADGSVGDNTLVGNMTWSDTPFNMVNGISLYNGANDVAGIKYSDVGDVGLQFIDKIWSVVDSDDTPQDCTSTSHTWICGEDTNATFIPDHFTLSDVNLTDHRDGNFTYLTYNDDLNMSSHLDLNISAMTEDGNVTKNFKSGALYYENPITVRLTIPDTSAPLLVKSKHEITTPTKLGFSDGNKHIGWDESNETQKIMFNYNKVINTTHQPFTIDGANVDINVASIYPATPPNTDANITGNSSADRNATFYYARIRPISYIYQAPVGATSIETPVAIDVYCDPYIVTCVDYGINTAEGEIDDPNWYLSLEHDTSLKDGNVSINVGLRLIEPSVLATDQAINGFTHASGDANIGISGGISNNTIVSRGNIPDHSLTIPLELVFEDDIPTPSNHTHAWLIHNKDEPISLNPLYKVRFIGEAEWTGVATTGHVVDTNASYKKTNKMNW